MISTVNKSILKLFRNIKNINHRIRSSSHTTAANEFLGNRKFLKLKAHKFEKVRKKTFNTIDNVYIYFTYTFWRDRKRGLIGNIF